MFNTLTRLSIMKTINSADTYDKSQIAKSLVVNILHVQMSIRVNSQPNPCEHTNSFFFLRRLEILCRGNEILCRGNEIIKSWERDSMSWD